MFTSRINKVKIQFILFNFHTLVIPCSNIIRIPAAIIGKLIPFQSLLLHFKLRKSTAVFVFLETLLILDPRGVLMNFRSLYCFLLAEVLF